MTKIIVSKSILEHEFPGVLFSEVVNLAKEKGLNEELVYGEILAAPNSGEVLKIIKEYFGDELIVQF